MKKTIIYLVYLTLIILSSISVDKNIQIKMVIDNPLKIHAGTFYYENDNKKYISVPVNYKDNNVVVNIDDARHISGLRYDPMEENGYIIIKKLFINGKNVDLKKLKPTPLHSISSISIVKNGLKIVSNDSDPYLLLIKNVNGKYYIKNFNFKLFLFLLLLMIIYKNLKIEKYNVSNVKKYMLFYLTFFTILSLISTWYILDLTDFSASFVSKIFFFDRFIDEFTIILLVTLLLISRIKPFFFFGILMFGTYISIWFSQLVSLAISGEFLTKLAMENVEFIGLMINYENISTVVFLFFIVIVLPLIITKLLINKIHYKVNAIVLFIVILFMGLSIHSNKYYLSKSTLNERKQLFNDTKLYHTAPVQALAKIYKKKKKKKESIVFSKTDIDNIRSFGFPLDTLSKYPLMKDTIYKKDLNLEWNQKPNVIVIFTEGTSARTIGAYNKKFEALTPNIDLFAKNQKTMIVKNYYNHTAATYRGLHGQLCSLYPKYGGVGGWHDNIDKLPKVDYKCLPHILNHNNYETIYLNMHYKNASSNEEMVSHFGFNDIESADSLGPKYVADFKKTRGDFLKDQESYQVLVNYLRKHPTNQKPFFLAMYTVQTHAWIDTEKDGVKFGDGNINGLNTIHNMDNAFGKFWTYFKNSQYYDNTIVIFTADHAHYYEKSFVKIMKKYKEDDYQKIFVDQIPLLIYMPVKFKKEYDAHNSSSISLAPTIAQLLDLKNEKNAFVGTSLFEENPNHMGFSSLGSDNYLILNHKVQDSHTVDEKNLPLYQSLKKYMLYSHILEEKNRVYDK